MKKIITLFFTLVFLQIPISAHAVTFRSGDQLTLPQDQTIDETVFVAAETLTVNSPINGDLYCAGRDVVINANIAGDIICAAETIKISGKFGGNLRVAARTIDTDALVQSSSSLLAQNLILRPTAQIGGDFVAGASTMDLGGSFARDIAVASSNLTFSGQAGRHAVVASKIANFANSSKIGGNLDLYSEAESTITLPENVVAGTTNRHQVDTSTTTKNDVAKASTAAWFTSRLVSVISFLLVGFVLLYFTKTQALSSASILRLHPFSSFFLGFAVLIFTPIIFIMALISVIGIPLAFILLFLYIIGMIIANVISAITFGRLLITKAFTNTRFHTDYYALIFGVLVLWLVFSIPGFGWILSFVSFCLGLGAFTRSFLPTPTKTTKKSEN